MSIISDVASSVTRASTLNTATSDTNSQVSSQEFLLLLVTQIQQQDPLNPQDPSEFTAQLAQFSSLEQLIRLNDSFEDLALIEGSSAMMSASNLIGQTVTVAGEALRVEGGQPGSIEYELGSTAESGHMNVYNESGGLVAVVKLPELGRGLHSLQWDGTLSDGTKLADGDYAFEITATDARGKVIGTRGYFSGQVSGISFDAGIVMLDIEGAQIPMSNLLRVRQTAPAA